MTATLAPALAPVIKGRIPGRYLNPENPEGGIRYVIDRESAHIWSALVTAPGYPDELMFSSTLRRLRSDIAALVRVSLAD